MIEKVTIFAEIESIKWSDNDDESGHTSSKWIFENTKPNADPVFVVGSWTFVCTQIQFPFLQCLACWYHPVHLC